MAWNELRPICREATEFLGFEPLLASCSAELSPVIMCNTTPITTKLGSKWAAVFLWGDLGNISTLTKTAAMLAISASLLLMPPQAIFHTL